MSGGKRKREGEALDDILNRPWCYYCERDFDDNAVLQNHQREMHFRCESCNRRLNTANGLTVHTAQVHKSQVTHIRNALPGREDPSLEIFGMYGIPDDLMLSHRQSIIDGYYKRAADFRAKTGNPLPGTVKQDPNVKGARAETSEERKARLAAHLAKRKAEKAAAAQEAQTGQAPTTAHPDPNGAGQEGDDFIALASGPADAVFSAEPFHQPNFTMSPYGPPPAYSPPNNNGAVYPAYPMHAFPANPMQPALPHQRMLPQQQTLPMQNFAPTQQAKKNSITPPAAFSGLPQRPSFDAPNLGQAEFATLHPQGSSHPVPAPYKAAAPDSAASPTWKSGEEAALPLHGHDGSRLNQNEALAEVVSRKPNGDLYWATTERGTKEFLSFEEIKAAADSARIDIDVTAEPTETMLTA